jgi:hypothetical protein
MIFGSNPACQQTPERHARLRTPIQNDLGVGWSSCRDDRLQCLTHLPVVAADLPAAQRLAWVIGRGSPWCR